MFTIPPTIVNTTSSPDPSDGKECLLVNDARYGEQHAGHDDPHHGGAPFGGLSPQPQRQEGVRYKTSNTQGSAPSMSE